MKAKQVLATVPVTSRGRISLVKAKVHEKLTKKERIKEAKIVVRKAAKRIKWNWEKERAAILIAQDLISEDAIAAKLDLEVETIYRWKKHPEFAAKVLALREEIAVEMKDRGVLKKENRLRVLENLHRHLVQIMDERQTKFAKRKTPGVGTGLMVRSVKAVGSGRQAKIVRQWELDTDLINQIKDVQRQIAQERGEWKEVHESKQTVVMRDYEGMSIQDV